LLIYFFNGEQGGTYRKLQYTEKLMLLELVDKYRTAVENKKTDACTMKVRIDPYNRQPRNIVMV